MARKVIILEKTPNTNVVGFRFAMWADVPAARQSFYANPSATSAVKNASAPELTAIQNGSVAETVREVQYPLGTNIAAIQADLVSLFTAYQTDVTAFNPWQRYGTSWDGNTWTPVSIA